MLQILPRQVRNRDIDQAAAGAGVPSPGNLGGVGLGGTSGSGVAAWAPVGGSTFGAGGGGVNFPRFTMSCTCTPSSVSYSSRAFAIISSLSRFAYIISRARL